jgi:hypothetical protein
MTQDNSTPSETPREEAPLHVVATDGTIYVKAHDQEKSRLYLAVRATEEALLPLVDPEKVDEARKRLLALSDAQSAYHHCRIERREERLLEWLPQHKPVIEAAFWPDESQLTINEYWRHRKCIVPMSTELDRK